MKVVPLKRLRSNKIEALVKDFFDKCEDLTEDDAEYITVVNISLEDYNRSSGKSVGDELENFTIASTEEEIFFS